MFVGALIAIIVMCLLPNAGSLGMSVGAALIFGLIMLMFLDTSINMAMQPFKMLVGDMVNTEQKTKAYSIQSFLCNAGSVVGYVFPFVLGWIGIKKTAPQGVIPDSVIFSFYAGAVILILCVIYTTMKVKEFPPAEYAQYNESSEPREKSNGNVFKLLFHAPKEFWTVGLVQFFCWFAFMYMWTYTNGTVAKNAFNTPTAYKIEKFVDVQDIPHKYIEMNGRIIVKDGIVLHQQDTVSFHKIGTKLLVANDAIKNEKDQVVGLKEGKTYTISSKTRFKTKLSLNTVSKEYQEAGDWVGILFAIQALASVLWATFIPRFRNRKIVYALSLLLGAIGFASTYVIASKWVLAISFIFIGCAWAAMLALPFTILTNALQGKGHMGTYLGLFNGTICLPQIVAAALGGSILGLFPLTKSGIANEPMMLVVAGVSLCLGAISVYIIKDKQE